MLQQYAAQHQNDTMALLAAKAASDAQKKIMAARPMQQMGTPPKVNEQVVASIAQPPQAPQPQMQSMQAPQAAPQAQGLPEDSGIAQLPAPNMQGLAGGGIVAFAGGGINDPMFRQFLSSLGKGSEFANGDPSTRKALLDAFARATSGPQMPVAGTVAPAPTTPAGVNYNDVKSPYQRLMSGPKAGLGSLAVPGAVALGGAALSNALANNLSNRSNEELDMLSNAGGGDDTALAAAILREDRNTRSDRAPVNYRGSKAYPYTGTQDPDPSARALRNGASSQASQDKAAADSGPRLKLDGSGAGAGTGGAAGPAATQGSDLTTLYKKIQAAQGAAADPYEADRNEIMKSRQAMAGEELTDAQARKEGLAALLSGRESRIKGREDRAEKAENLNTKMAVINAGLAMMQSTGKGLAGIAEGATKGMGMYSEGLKLTAAERQKIEDAKDSFDDLKFNSENLTQKEITAAKNKVSEVANMTREKHIDALMDDRKIKREEAGKIFDATARQVEGVADRANRLQIAGMPNGQMQLALALGGGNAEAGMRKLTEIAAGKFNIQEAYANYLKGMGPGGMGVSPQEFAAQIRALAPQVVDVGKQPLLARPSGG
jgi:hypothetical protein